MLVEAIQSEGMLVTKECLAVMFSREQIQVDLFGSVTTDYVFKLLPDIDIRAAVAARMQNLAAGSCEHQSATAALDLLEKRYSKETQSFSDKSKMKNFENGISTGVATAQAKAYIVNSRSKQCCVLDQLFFSPEALSLDRINNWKKFVVAAAAVLPDGSLVKFKEQAVLIDELREGFEGSPLYAMTSRCYAVQHGICSAMPGSMTNFNKMLSGARKHAVATVTEHYESVGITKILVNRGLPKRPFILGKPWFTKKWSLVHVVQVSRSDFSTS